MANGEPYIVKLVVAVLAALLSGGAGGWYLRPQLDPEKFVTRREFDREINSRLVGQADLLELLDRKLGPLEKGSGACRGRTEGGHWDGGGSGSAAVPG